jgi:hypothetical protein
MEQQQRSSGARKALGEQVNALVAKIEESGVQRMAHNWRRKMTTAAYAVSWGAVVCEYYIAEAKEDAKRMAVLSEFLDTVVAQEMAELPGYPRDTVLAYLRRGVVMSRLKAAKVKQVFTDLTLHGVDPERPRGVWAGMPFIRPASLGRAKRCLEMMIALSGEPGDVLAQAEADYLDLSDKLDTFVELCRVVRPDYEGMPDDEVCNEFDPDYLRCVQSGVVKPTAS